MSEGLFILAFFIGLPWLILHYVTRWKTAKTLTSDDEDMIDQMYHYARKLDDRMETLERIVAAEHPDFQPSRSTSHINRSDDAVSIDAWKTRTGKGATK